MAPDGERAGREGQMPAGGKDIFCQAASRACFSPAQLFLMLPKLWSGKEPSCLSLISLKMLILTLLCIFMSQWCPSSAMDRQDELPSQHTVGAHSRNRGVPRSAQPHSPPARTCWFLEALKATAELQWVCSETPTGFFQQYLFPQRTSVSPRGPCLDAPG